MPDAHTDAASPPQVDAASSMLDMQAFFPYRLAVLADAVSRTIAELYAQRFSLTRHEWRVLVALANSERTTARDVALYSTLDKMQVSRAVDGLERRGLLVRGEGRADRRTKQLKITPAGRALFGKIVPMVKERQDWLLAVLSAEERAVLDRAMDRVFARAREILPE